MYTLIKIYQSINIILYDCVVEVSYLLQTLVCMSYRCNISSICSRNSEAFASEFLEHIEEMCPRHLKYLVENEQMTISIF